MKQTKRLCFLVLILIMSYSYLFAGNTGKIAGRVIDQETKEAVIGVTVLIEGTSLGAATDVNGYYIINNVPPGTYTLSFSAVGYQKKRVANVKVSVDFTTKQNIELKSGLLA